MEFECHNFKTNSSSPLSIYFHAIDINILFLNNVHIVYDLMFLLDSKIVTSSVCLNFEIYFAIKYCLYLKFEIC